MREKDKEYFELYDNIEECQIAYLCSEDILIGRALLWDNLEGKVSKFMDRIYYANDTILAAFKRWAKEHGYAIKTYQDFGHKRFFTTPSGEVVVASVYLNVRGALYDLQALPFCDTMSYYKEGVLSNARDLGCFTLEGTNGQDLDEQLLGTCYFCHRDPELRVNDLPVCSECAQECFVVCDCCGQAVREDECVYIESADRWLCEDCFSAEGFICSRCGEPTLDADEAAPGVCSWCHERR